MKKSANKITSIGRNSELKDDGNCDSSLASNTVDRSARSSGGRSSLSPSVTKMRKEGFLEKFRKHMTAVAYAEAGEFEVAQEVVNFSRGSSTVLLVIEGTTPDPSTFEHALHLCRRTNSELDVLQVIEVSDGTDDYKDVRRSLSDVSQNIVGIMKKAEDRGISLKVTVRLGDVNEKLFNYASRHRDVVMVILDSAKARSVSENRKALKRLGERLARKLSIPLITVDPREPICVR